MLKSFITLDKQAAPAHPFQLQAGFAVSTLTKLFLFVAEGSGIKVRVFIQGILNEREAQYS